MSQTALYAVVLPSTLAEIQASAFQGCIQLSYVTFPGHVIEIDGTAFVNSIWEHKEEARAMGLGFAAPSYG